MKKHLVVFFVILVVSCTYNSKEPDYVIPKDDMVNIILDIHIMDGLLNINSIKDEFEEKMDSSDYYYLIFEKYGYDEKDFDTSLYYYGEHINKYDEIYEQVLNKLTLLDADIKEKNRRTDADKQ